MQIVIEMDDILYGEFLTYGIVGLDVDNQIEISKAIRNGTPLPNNHGDLIDRNELLDCSYEIDAMYGLYDLVVSVGDVNDAPTIIEEVKADG